MLFNILNNKSIWKLLVLFSYSPGAGFTRKEFQNILKWNNLTLDRTLNKLIFYKILIKQKRVFKFNFENNSHILQIIDYEKKKLNYPSFELFLILHDFIRYCENNIGEMYLFGSYAKKTASVNSDIDIAIYSSADLTYAIEKISDKYSKKIQIHNIIPKSELDKEVKKHGIKLI